MTKTKLLLAAAAALALPGTIAATGAVAQVSGVAVADPDGAIAGTKAWTAARAQIQTTYKAQIDQANARRTALSAEIQPLVTQFQTAQRAPGATDASLQPQAQAIQARENAANQELGTITAPVTRAQQYAIEQLRAKLPDAVQNASRARNVSLLLSPQAAIFAQPAADITSSVTAELDKLIPSVSITPPAGWQPGQQGGGQSAPASAPSAPATGRRSSGR
ncbi:OmpH family outer membrane protein [uncultured Sphingomonas sp.]|uniref:OmpH family outer membrane protein n=1 Tax=uncultured Sphingomonas sp. TaxID=158754 RepID=UPI0035CBDDF5